MITRTFIDKCTTIFRDSNDNYGLYPVGMLSYGKNLSRVLIHFDITKLRDLVEDKTYGCKKSLKHILRLTNCGSIDKKKFHRFATLKNENDIVERATSFDIIAFKVPKPWDEGSGFDGATDFWLFGKNANSQNGCNWFQPSNGELWNEEGVISINSLYAACDAYDAGNDSIVVAKQHFDRGNENFEMDITKYVNWLLENPDKNYGLCLAFAPVLEEAEFSMTQYVGFFTNNTNTIFKPVLETREIGNKIIDDRYSFYLNKTNRLYLYVSIGGELRNLDTMPMCMLSNGELCNVKHQRKGVYYAEIKLNKGEYEPNMILNDKWYNLYYNGDKIDDMEMEFVTLKPEIYFNLGENLDSKKTLSVSIFGVNDGEKMPQGEKRMVKTIYKKPYTYNDYILTEDSQYRIYVKDGSSEIDIIEWDEIERANDYNYFFINTDELVPSEYHIDIRLNYGNEIVVYKDELTFKVVGNKTALKK